VNDSRPNHQFMVGQRCSVMLASTKRWNVLLTLNRSTDARPFRTVTQYCSPRPDDQTT
jgi:hypothetical protein